MEGRQWISKERGFWVILLSAVVLIPWYQIMTTDPSSDCNLVAEERVQKMNSSIAVGEKVEWNASKPGMIKATNFLRDPIKTVSAFEGCLHDKNCRFTYHHAYKTGGTTIEAVFEQICSQRHEQTCCDDLVLEKFVSRQSYFCHAKFSSWQVHSEEFWGVVDKCSQMLYKTSDTSWNETRYVIFTTFRDPIEMLVSHINQHCNKNLNRRTPRVLEACMACNYSSHSDVWDEYVDEINRQVSSIYNVTTVRAHSLSNVIFDRLQVFTLQPSEIDIFFRTWNPPNYQTLVHKNPEDLSNCNFQIPSAMMKNLRPAQELYRRLLMSL